MNVAGSVRGALVFACVEGPPSFAHQIKKVSYMPWTNIGTPFRVVNQMHNPSEVSTLSGHSTVQDILHALMPNSCLVSLLLIKCIAFRLHGESGRWWMHPNYRSIWSLLYHSTVEKFNRGALMYYKCGWVGVSRQGNNSHDVWEGIWHPDELHN